MRALTKRLGEVGSTTPVLLALRWLVSAYFFICLGSELVGEALRWLVERMFLYSFALAHERMFLYLFTAVILIFLKCSMVYIKSLRLGIGSASRARLLRHVRRGFVKPTSTPPSFVGVYPRSRLEL